MKHFLKKPQVKNVVLGILTIIIGALCSSLGNWNEFNTAFWIKAISALILTILYCALLAIYSTWEVNERSIRGILEDRVKAYEEIMIGIDNICKQSASEVNSVIHSIVEDGLFNPNIWNFDKASMLVCKHIYDLLGRLKSGTRDFGVAYIKLDENIKPEVEICMNAFANQNMSKPTVFRKKRRIDNEDDRNYHDVELFRLGKSDIDIRIGKEEVDQVFSYVSKERRNENKNKYNQYIGIPVFCNDSKMVGLLEIVCLNETSLGKTKSEVEEIASKYIVPYSYLLLLLHKLEKALSARPV